MFEKKVDRLIGALILLVESGVLENRLLEPIWISSGELLQNFAILPEDECRHAGNVVESGNLLALVDINLENDDVGSVRLAEFLQGWRNTFARAAPNGKEVDDNNFVTGGFELLLQIFLMLDFMNHLVLIALIGIETNYFKSL